MNALELVNQLPKVAAATTDWDSTVYERAFTESPAEQLYNSTPERVLLSALNQPEFVQTVLEIADEDNVEPSDVIRSLHRTLTEYADA